MDNPCTSEVKATISASTSSSGIDRLLELVSPRVGVIRSLVRVTRGLEEPNPPIIYHALLSHFDFRKAPLLDRGATGKGATENEAMAGAIGEALEHYCASHIDKTAIRKITLSEIGPESVSPVECVLYS